MNKKRDILFLILLIAFLIFINYNFLDRQIENFLTEQEYTNVIRIIDGDTIVAGNNTHVRLLGINTPETGEPYHDEAAKSLSDMISNRTVKLEFGKDKTDKYGRTLAYIFLNNTNINLEQVRKGFANVYILGDTKYKDILKNAWNECIAKNRNLCEKSKEKCAGCVELENLDIKTQTATFFNNCSFECNITGWDVKDEGRKNFYFPEYILKSKKGVSVVCGNRTGNETVLFWKGYDYIWTAGGDTLFLRDKEGKLILWKNF